MDAYSHHSNDTKNLDDVITLREAGQMSGYHPDYLSFLIRNGKLQGQKLGKTWVTSQSEVRRFLELNDTPSPIRRAIISHKRWLGRMARPVLVITLAGGALVAAYLAGYMRGYCHDVQEASCYNYYYP
jgi:hypothetical protein